MFFCCPCLNVRAVCTSVGNGPSYSNRVGEIVAGQGGVRKLPGVESKCALAKMSIAGVTTEHTQLLKKFEIPLVGAQEVDWSATHASARPTWHAP